LETRRSIDYEFFSWRSFETCYITSPVKELQNLYFLPFQTDMVLEFK